MPGFHGHGEVGYKGVLGLAGAMGNDGGVAGSLSHSYSLDRLGDGADLVELDENGVAGAHGYALFQTLGVGDEEIVAHDLDLVPQGFGKLDIALPIVLIQAVLDGDDGILAHPLGIELDQLVGGEKLIGIGFPELVTLATALVEEFAGCAVQGDGHLLAGPVAGLFDSLHDELQGFLVVQVGSEAAFVAHRGIVPGAF